MALSVRKNMLNLSNIPRRPPGSRSVSSKSQFASWVSHLYPRYQPEGSSAPELAPVVSSVAGIAELAV